MEITAESLRFASARGLTIGDLGLVLARAFGGGPKRDITEDVVVEARRRRGLE